METLQVICPNKDISNELKDMFFSFAKNFSNYELTHDFTENLDFTNKKILFLLELNLSNFDIPMLVFLEKLIKHNKNSLAFKGSTAAVMVHSSSSLGTKRATQDLIFIANNLGCNFIGQPLVEATFDYKNFSTWQKTMDIPLKEICLKLSDKLGKRLLEYKKSSIKNPSITVLYSSPHKVSNTLDLWHMISKHLNEYSINELQIENGKILDCKGCSYKTCLHYSKKNTCFYGGFIVENVLPAIEKADAVVWLCPNYNDAIAANLTASINRLTVLYNKISFYKKSMLGIVVSGNSGSDSVAKQLIGALNINKGFRLPPNAVLTATANDPGSIFEIENINDKALNFANNIKQEI